MKNIILILIALFCLTSCTQNDVEISNQYVYNGLGGIKCEVNGVLLKPRIAFVYSNTDFIFDSDYNNINFTSFSFHNSNTSKGLGFQSLRVKIMNVNSTTDLKGNVYLLNYEMNNESFGNYIKEDLSVKYNTNNIVNGELKVLYHDVKEGKVGGTFWFDAINDNGVIVKVRNRQFDLTN